MRSLVKEIFPKIPFLLFILQLKRVLGDCHTVLDIGCGSLSPLRFINAQKHGLDIDKLSLNKARKANTHESYSVVDAREVSSYFLPKSFDAAVALDVIEHLSKKEGHRLIASMEIIARKKIIIFTPNGFHYQYKKNLPWEEHESGWDFEEMQRLGFKVIGIFGYKKLRGEYHKLRFKPEVFWGLISELTQWFYTRWYPKQATALLCVKDIEFRKKEEKF